MSVPVFYHGPLSSDCAVLVIRMGDVAGLGRVTQGIGQQVAHRTAERRRSPYDLAVLLQLERYDAFLGHGLVELQQRQRVLAGENRSLCGEIHAALGLGSGRHLGRRCVPNAEFPRHWKPRMSRYVAASRLVVSATCVCVSRLLMGVRAAVREVRREIGKALEVLLQAVQHAVQLLRQIGHFHRHGLNWHALGQFLTCDHGCA